MIKNHDDALHEECGIFGMYGSLEAAEKTYLGLYALQHRGQECAGIAWSEGGRIAAAKGMGLLHNAIEQQCLTQKNAPCAIGHVRYTPLPGSQLHNVLPIGANYARGAVAVSHDGLITNLKELTAQLEKQGAISVVNSSEAILRQLAHKSHMQPLDAHRFLRKVKREVIRRDSAP